MSKQDRQGARNISEFMSRYNLGKSFAEMFGLANEAKRVAEEAKSTASDPAKNLTHEEIFNLLTKNGALQGIYRGEDGELYINASYIMTGEFLANLIKTGVITSKDGSVKIDLANNCVTVDGKRSATVDGVTKDYKTQVVISASGTKIFGENSEGEMEETLNLKGGVGGIPAGITNDAWQESVGLLIAAVSGVLTLGTSEVATEIVGSSVSIDSPTSDLRILGKQVYWRDNGDGTHTLCGS